MERRLQIEVEKVGRLLVAVVARGILVSKREVYRRSLLGGVVRCCVVCCCVRDGGGADLVYGNVSVSKVCV